MWDLSDFGETFWSFYESANIWYFWTFWYEIDEKGKFKCVFVGPIQYRPDRIRVRDEHSRARRTYFWFVFILFHLKHILT